MTLKVIKNISSIPSIKRLLEITFPVPHIKAAVKIPPIILKIEVSFFDLLFSTHEIIIFEKS